jgi:hypothetical protein
MMPWALAAAAEAHISTKQLADSQLIDAMVVWLYGTSHSEALKLLLSPISETVLACSYVQDSCNCAKRRRDCKEGSE